MNIIFQVTIYLLTETTRTESQQLRLITTVPRSDKINYTVAKTVICRGRCLKELNCP